jgi:hypothetical protein
MNKWATKREFLDGIVREKEKRQDNGIIFTVDVLIVYFLDPI